MTFVGVPKLTHGTIFHFFWKVTKFIYLHSNNIPHGILTFNPILQYFAPARESSPLLDARSLVESLFIHFMRHKFPLLFSRSRFNSKKGVKKKGTKPLHFWSKIHSGIAYSVFGVKCTPISFTPLLG